MTLDHSQSTGPIPVMRPLLPRHDRVVPFLARIDSTRIYSNNGPLVRDLEARIAQICRVDPSLVVAAANATVALEGVCCLAPVDSFIVPAFTFPASAHAVLRSGKTLILGDIGAADWQLDSKGSKDNGIMRVMPFGANPELTRDDGSGYLVVDAAASFGALPLDLSSIRSGQCVVFSLHATKVLGAGEGGVAVFGSRAEASRFRAWINFGFAGSRESQFPATNGKLSEVGAAYALAALEQRDDELNDWALVNARAAEISEALDMSSPVSGYPGVSPYWIVELASGSVASALEAHLHDVGIETRRWWGRGCHRMPAFSRVAGDANFPITDAVSSKTLGLPMFRDLSDSQLLRIEREIRAFLGK